MWAYIVRRLLYTIPVVFGVLLITFILFNVVPGGNQASEMAGKAASAENIAEIKKEYGWDKPLLINLNAVGEHGILAAFDSQFFHHFKNAASFNFKRSHKTRENILDMLIRGAPYSLALTVPMFLLTLSIAVCIALTVAFVRGTAWDVGIVFLCVFGMSLPYLAYILLGQYFFAFKLGWFPVTSHDHRWIGLALPILIGVTAGVGGDVRFYRTVMLDEMNADYVRTAYAKGVTTPRALFVHVLKNAMIPVITRVVLAIPFLFLGSLLLERFFGIPGLGDMTISAINGRDFPVISAMTFIISILFVLGNLATDICYSIVDPRITLS